MQILQNSSVHKHQFFFRWLSIFVIYHHASIHDLGKLLYESPSQTSVAAEPHLLKFCFRVLKVMRNQLMLCCTNRHQKQLMAKLSLQVNNQDVINCVLCVCI